MSQFAKSVKKLRIAQHLSMQTLAEKAGVSKSMISKIERDEAQPTLDIAGRLANALGKTLSEVLHTPQTAQVVFLPRQAQAIWKDAAGIKRRNISPVSEGLSIEWLDVELPPGALIQKNAPPNTSGDTRYILVKSGELKVTVCEQPFLLKSGDSLYFEASTHTLHNETDHPVECFVVMKH